MGIYIVIYRGGGIRRAAPYRPMLVCMLHRIARMT